MNREEALSLLHAKLDEYPAIPIITQTSTLQSAQLGRGSRRTRHRIPLA